MTRLRNSFVLYSFILSLLAACASPVAPSATLPQDPSRTWTPALSPDEGPSAAFPPSETPTITLTPTDTSTPTITPLPRPAVERVMIVSYDGLRPDAIFPAPMPNLLALEASGAYTLQARTIFPSSTLPAHASMLTGMCPDQTGRRLLAIGHETLADQAASTMLQTALEVTARVSSSSILSDSHPCAFRAQRYGSPARAASEASGGAAVRQD